MDAEKYDLILEYIARDENRNVNVNKHLLHKEVFPELNTDQIVRLIDEMEYLKPEVFRRYNKGTNSPITSNGLTKTFLEQGGFTKIKKDAIEEQRKIDEKDDLELEKTKVDLELAKETLKELPKAKRQSRLAIIISVIAIIFQIIQWIVSLQSK